MIESIIASALLGIIVMLALTLARDTKISLMLIGTPLLLLVILYAYLMSLVNN